MCFFGPSRVVDKTGNMYTANANKNSACCGFRAGGQAMMVLEEQKFSRAPILFCFFYIRCIFKEHFCIGTVLGTKMLFNISVVFFPGKETK